jgi:hypothetical protein
VPPKTVKRKNARTDGQENQLGLDF